MNSPESAASAQRIQISRRSPVIAALLSLFAPGSGQIYNKQLEKSVLLWLWFFILLVFGLALLILGILARWLPSAVTHPPMSDWIRAHQGALLALWLAAMGVLWLVNVCDAFVTAPRINAYQRVHFSPARRRAGAHMRGDKSMAPGGFVELSQPTRPARDFPVSSQLGCVAFPAAI